MRIVATADLHADLDTHMAVDELERLRDEIAALTPDVLIVAGDLVGLGKVKIQPTLELLRPLAPERLIVPGNHDLWLAEGDSFAYWRDELPRIYAHAGFHMLDGGPRVVEDVGFVGNVAWYDYGFADPELPPTRERSYERKRWEGVAGWNDGVFVRLGMSDPEFAALLNERLARDLDSIAADARVLVAVTHHIAFSGMVERRADDPAWTFNNAFLGNPALGDLLAERGVEHHICGHTHKATVVRSGGVRSVNVGSTYQRKQAVLIEL